MCQSKIEVSSYNRPTTIDFLSWLFKEVYNEEIHNIEANQYYSTSTVLELSSTASANFNLTCLRRAYLCRYATCHTLLIKGCINRFLTEYSKAEELLKGWKSNPFYCSLSLGPALDYIAFGFAIQDRSLSSWSDIRVRMVTRCTGWEKTTDIFSQAMHAFKCMPFLKLESSTVLAGSVFEPWTSGAKKCLEKSNLIFMFKSLDLEEKKGDVNTVYLLELVNILKHGTTILFIDTSYSSSVMQDVLAKCPGTYLYGPISVSCNNKESSEQKQTDSREKPVLCAVADFFVWQKNDNSPKLTQLNKSSENKLNSLKICDNSPKSELHDKSQAQVNLIETATISSDNSVSSISSSSSLSPPTLIWKVKQEDPSNRETDGIKRKIYSLIERIDKLSSFIEKDIYPSSQDFVDVTEVNTLTRRINKLATTLESNMNNQT